MCDKHTSQSFAEVINSLFLQAQIDYAKLAHWSWLVLNMKNTVYYINAHDWTWQIMCLKNNFSKDHKVMETEVNDSDAV